ncbi:MAG TPA: hypothetical protein VIU61_07665 [Kofleriaceae bacterium]
MKDDMNTPPESWRTEEEPSTRSISTTPTIEATRAWRAAFTAQCTADMMDDVTAYAAKHASWIEQRTRRRDPDLVEELVQDALADTFAGVVTWEPKRCPLALHLKTVIRSRVTHELERAETFEHHALENAAENEVSSAMAATAAPTSGPELDRYADDFDRRLRKLAAGDEGVITLIELYREGVTEKRDVCRVAKMKGAEYHNAHRRLKRLVEKLPQNLRTAAIEEMA